jgi:hypothetical protein
MRIVVGERRRAPGDEYGNDYEDQRAQPLHGYPLFRCKCNG